MFPGVEMGVCCILGACSLVVYALYASVRSLRRWVRLAACVDSVVLRGVVGGGSSLRNRGRLEGGGISPRRPAGMEGIMAFSTNQLWECRLAWL